MASGSIHNCGKKCDNNGEEMLPLEFPPTSRLSEVRLFLGVMLVVITAALKDVDIVFPLILTCYDNATSCIFTLRDRLHESENAKKLVISNNITKDLAINLTTSLTHRIEKLNAIVVYLERCVNAVLYLHTEKQQLTLLSNDDTIEKCINCKCDTDICENIIGIATLNCGHHLCAECLNNILDSKKCPGCDCDIENFQELIANVLDPIVCLFNDC